MFPSLVMFIFFLIIQGGIPSKFLRSTWAGFTLRGASSGTDQNVLTGKKAHEFGHCQIGIRPPSYVEIHVI